MALILPPRSGAALAALAALVLLPAAPPSAAAPVRAAYFYDYMGVDHLDSLAAAGFDRAVIHWITDSLGTRGALKLNAFLDRGRRVGIVVTPEWALQARARLAALPTARRYTWGAGTVENDVGCPLDSLFWRSALLDRADEILAAAPGVTRLAVDLEIYFGGRHHYDAGPCRCPYCLREYLGGAMLGGRDPRRLAGLLGWERSRLTRLLAALLSEFATAHPGVELGVFDLDYDSFVHRALARALARAHVPTADYTERTYGTAGGSAPAARAVLDALGLEGAPLIGGLWLKRFAPKDVPAALQSLLDRADGYFVFTTYSLWLDPSKLAGPYTLPGDPASYWAAFRQANRIP